LKDLSLLQQRLGRQAGRC